MKVAISGASGLIGSALLPLLHADGHEVVTLVRRSPRHPSEIAWSPERGTLDSNALHGVEAAVHLAGAGIGDKRWTPTYQREILQSRIEGTRLFAAALAALSPRPRVLLSGSAIGWYGETGDRETDERAPHGTGFLADVVRQWEAATEPAESVGIRTVHLRTGIVFDSKGGALAKQLLPARLGLGGPLGSGRQYQSWITLQDEVQAIRFLLTAESVAGPVNLTAPQPLPQREVARALGRALHRPAILPLPAFALRLLFGGFADEGLLVSQRIVPRVLAEAGFQWAARDIDTALDQILG